MLSARAARGLVDEVHRILRDEQRAGTFGDHIGDDLSGACGMGAALVVLALQWQGLEAFACGGHYVRLRKRGLSRWPHWWAQSADGWILDPTVMQFNPRLRPRATKKPQIGRDIYSGAIVPLSYMASLNTHPTSLENNATAFIRMVHRLGISGVTACEALGWEFDSSEHTFVHIAPPSDKSEIVSSVSL